MKPEFTADGIEVQTYQEIYDELVVGYKAIYGNDIDLSPNTPDGQRVGIEAQARLDLQSYGLALYNQLDPDFALGQALNRMVKYCGISRRPGIRSQADLTVTADRALTLESGYTVEDTLGQQWLTLQDNTLIAGANTVTVHSQVFGPVAAGIGTITIPITFVVGVLSITNTAIATLGQAEETDAQLRRRRNLSLVSPETSTVGGLYTALGNIPDVTDLKIYENFTDIADPVKLIDPHTIWCIVDGGSVAEIVEVLAKTKNGGTGLKGSVTGTYIETITIANGQTYTYTHEMQFDRPTEVDLYVQLTVTRKDILVPINIQAIKDSLVTKTYGIGENAQANELYAQVYAGGNTFIATDLEIGLDGMVWTDGNEPSGADERFVIVDANITITEV